MRFSLFLILLIPIDVSAETRCDLGVFRKKPGHIIGFGGGDSHKEAKIQAIGDAMSFFGIKIKVESNLYHDNSEAVSEQKVSSKTEAFAKAVEVLYSCKDDGGQHVIVGIEKKKLVHLIKKGATERQEELNEMSLELQRRLPDRDVYRLSGRLKEVILTEKREKEMWILLEQGSSAFPKLNSDLLTIVRVKLKEKLDQIPPIEVSSNGPISARTLSDLITCLNRLGYKAKGASKPGATVWTCDIEEGMKTNNYVRFSVNCHLNGVNFRFDPVRIESMATISNIEDTGAAFIKKALWDKKYISPLNLKEM